jgi:hypothetical protein
MRDMEAAEDGCSPRHSIRGLNLLTHTGIGGGKFDRAHVLTAGLPLCALLRQRRRSAPPTEAIPE